MRTRCFFLWEGVDQGVRDLCLPTQTVGVVPPQVHIGWKRGLDGELAPIGVGRGQARCMQGLTRCTSQRFVVRREGPVGQRVEKDLRRNPVEAIAEEREAGVGKMNADLVRSSGM